MEIEGSLRSIRGCGLRFTMTTEQTYYQMSLEGTRQYLEATGSTYQALVRMYQRYSTDPDYGPVLLQRCHEFRNVLRKAERDYHRYQAILEKISLKSKR